MSHQRTPGRFFVTHIGAAGSEALIEVQKSTELVFKNKQVEVTDIGDDGWEAALDGMRGWTAKVEINYDQNDTELASALDNIISPTKTTDINCVIGQQTSTGDIAWYGVAKMKDTPITSQVDGIVLLTLDLQGNLDLAKQINKQYDYYTSDPQFRTYEGDGVVDFYYDGSTFLRKVISGGVYKKQISTDMITWTDLSPLIYFSGSKIRNGVSGGDWYVQQWNGSAWTDIEGPTSAGGTGNYRDGVRDGHYVLDEALTPTAWSGVEGIDWINIYEL